jgi:putative flippase GtrA
VKIPTAQRAAVRPFLTRALREPDPGILRQGLRFALAGGTVAVVYLTTTTVLAEVLGLAFQAALAIGFCVAVLMHFTLQRLFVWTHHDEFALPLRHQVGRYLTYAAAQYGATAAATALLPSLLGVSAEIVYLATVAVIVCSNFAVFRYGIFHAKPSADDPDREAPAFAAASPAHTSVERPTR